MGYDIGDGRRVRWYQSARRHRVGRTHAIYVMTTVEPEPVLVIGGLDPRLRWEGADSRGVELEIVALDLPGEIVVIHVMPTALRRRP